MSSYLGCHLYNEEDDTIVKPAQDVFEINDFTAATEWENFIDDIENILRNWQVCNASRNTAELERKDFLEGSWKCRKEKLDFYDFPFLFCHYRLVNTDPEGKMSEGESGDVTPVEEDGEDGNPEDSTVATDLMSSCADFCPRGPVAALQYGLREILLICPAGDDILGNDTRAKMVLGAVNIAVHNTQCNLPVLVQVMESKKELYCGTAIASNARTEFSCVGLNRRPAHCGHLSGLLDLFRNKIHQPLPVDLPSARVSIRLSYRLEDWASHEWTIDPPDLSLFSLSGDTDFVQLASLPFGCAADPVSGLTLHTTWRDLNEDLVTDSEIHTDLDPLEAPEWSVEVSLLERADCLLARHLDTFHQLCADTRSVKQLLGDLVETEEVETGVGKVSEVLDRMGGPAVANYSLTQTAGSLRPLLRRGSPTEGPLPPPLLKLVLSFLFPDCDSTSCQPYPDTLDLPAYCGQLYSTGVKTAPPNSLVWRLATAAACCLQWAGAAGVAHLMHELCLELRYRWENSLYIPGLPLGLPDHSQSLLHQKLQLLNCCVARKVAREEGERKEKEERIPEEIVVEDSDTDMEEDEFFECEEEKEDTPGPGLPAWEKPEGRLGRVGELRMLSGRDWLYIPTVQDPAPLTEDQLAEQAEVMLQLGSDQAGAEVRARMQSANLLSDMESFKAANPGSELADFVRWHSPRDWEEGRGLSGRMKSEGNLWCGLWEQARAVPARRQRRLFDDTREAEKVVQWMTGLTPGDVAQLLLPTLLQAGHLRLLEATPDSTDTHTAHLHQELSKMIGRISTLQCLPEVRHFRGQIDNSEFGVRAQVSTQVSQLVWLLEQRVAQCLSLRKKFLYDLSLLEEGEEEQPDSVEEMARFVSSLGKGGEVRVLGAARGPAGRLIQSMFRESQQEEYPRATGLPPPSLKQFVVRSTASRPFPHSRPVPQRMYARLGPGEFKLAGAFTVDRQYS